MSDALVALWRSLESYQAGPVPLKAWVTLTVKRAVVDGIRRRHGRTGKYGNRPRKRLLSLPTVAEPVTLPCFDLDERDAVEFLVRTLDTRSKYVLYRYYLRGMTFKDIGLECGYSEAMIFRIHSLAIRKLRRHLGKAVS